MTTIDPNGLCGEGFDDNIDDYDGNVCGEDGGGYASYDPTSGGDQQNSAADMGALNCNSPGVDCSGTTPTWTVSQDSYNQNNTIKVSTDAPGLIETESSDYSSTLTEPEYSATPPITNTGPVLFGFTQGPPPPTNSGPQGNYFEPQKVPSPPRQFPGPGGTTVEPPGVEIPWEKMTDWQKVIWSFSKTVDGIDNASSDIMMSVSPSACVNGRTAMTGQSCT